MPRITSTGNYPPRPARQNPQNPDQDGHPAKKIDNQRPPTPSENNHNGLNNKLRAHTPDAAKALRVTVSTYPMSGYDLQEVLTQLATGEAIARS